MQIAAGWSVTPKDTEAAIEAYSKLTDCLESPPSFMLVHVSPVYDASLVIKQLSLLAPGVPLLGGTTCFGVMTVEGYHTVEGRGMGILGFLDSEGSYGVGISEVTENVKTAAKTALEQALVAAGRPGEMPTAILISSYPGEEEHIIRTIEEHVGTGVPIFGGTSADNDMSGQWKQFGNDKITSKGVSIAVLFSSGDIGYAFHSGYEPTEHRGRATRTDGRILYEIDNRPAAQVYNEWTDGLIRNVLTHGGNLVPTVSLKPLGNPVGRIGEVPYYRIAYPVEVLENQALLLYTDAPHNSEVVLMSGTHDSLTTRAGRVAAAAIDSASFETDQVEGALVLFCTGSMLVIQDRLKESVDGLREALDDAPFLCTFTLGEQGCFISGENRHANLMIAALVFGPEIV
jgi:hypothetical protein